MDTVRVLRVIEYTGPRDMVERRIEMSIHGTKSYGPTPDKQVIIRVATVGEFPEILEPKADT